MRIAIIDLGTNSVRFDVHQILHEKSVRLLHREKIMIRLGQGVFVSGRLDKNAMHRTLHTLLKFKTIAERLHVTKIVAFATSALREIRDQHSLIQTIRDRTGIDIRVISGVEEARLIALGILSNERVSKDKVALVDIGGGSTEISICQDSKILFSASLPLGTARLQQVFLEQSPPSPDRIKGLRRHVKDLLSQKLVREKWPQVNEVIGSSGTIRALERIFKKTKKGPGINFTKLKNLTREMSSMTTTELLGISGMEAKRVDMILAGAILFEECMHALGAKKARTTDFSLRDGILEEQKLMHKETQRSSLKAHLPDLYEKAKSLGANESQLRRSVKMAETLFQRLKPVHKLESDWMTYLSAATILRNTGEAISPANHEEHSFYIVKQANLPMMQDWETELIARLCLHHEGSKLAPKELDFVGNKQRKAAFIKLLAMLRIVDALDTGPETRLHLKQVRPQRNHVKLLLSGQKLTGLENLNIEMRKGLFQQVFERTLEAILS